MAQFHSRYGIKTQSYITTPIDEDGSYTLYTKKGLGKYPKFDEETVECHTEQLFAIRCDDARFYRINNRNKQLGYPLGSWYFWYNQPGDLEKIYLSELKASIEAHGIPVKLIARGTAHRRGKRAWQFSTIEYLINTEENGILLKLMGIEGFGEAVFKKIEDELDEIERDLAAR